MTIRSYTLAVSLLAASSCLPFGLQAQQSCSSVQPGSNLPESAGCIPLTYKPADGGPQTSVFAPVSFVGPVETSTHAARPTAHDYRSFDVGVNAFYTNPDYGGNATGNVDVGAFAAYTMRYFGLEVDAADTVRTSAGIHEPYIVAGPRVQYRTRHFTVYAKAQAGIGHFSGATFRTNLNHQNYVVENYGAGLEFKVARHLKIRAVDANYQVWPTFSPNNLSPIHIGSGVAYSF